jgi:hypothetical protein
VFGVENGIHRGLGDEGTGGLGDWETGRLGDWGTGSVGVWKSGEGKSPPGRGDRVADSIGVGIPKA